MWSYVPPIDDIRFVLDELLNVRRDWNEMPRLASLDADLVPQILEEAGKFAVGRLLPMNSSGDLEGCRFSGGTVHAPTGFAAAYRDFCAAGWPALACDAGSGGQGLPQTLNAALYEMLNATNHAWAMYPGLAHGAYECIRAHGSDHLKEHFLPKIVSGEWLTTMCLTEAHAGSDVGLLRTAALPRSGGTYAISGSKVFISGGDHDLSDNIIHLVLARLPDAPAGTRGISLFVVPKLLAHADGLRPNGVRCDGIEKKMGIKGSATCLLRFEAAQGWIVGEPNRGLAAMLVMMNEARLHVGLQGLGHADAALLNATRYAAERLQMRAPASPPGVEAGNPAPATPIAFHPPIRRVLATARAMVEGQRALAYWAAHLLDVAEFHPSQPARERAHALASILTPVVKSFLTENGFLLSSAALQVWGGYGYVHDFGIEQTVRDSRIAMIYEGTNEIQAIDLLSRKILADEGAKFGLLIETVRDEAARCRGVAECGDMAAVLDGLTGSLMTLTDHIMAGSVAFPELAPNVAGDFLRALGLSLLAALWARAARVAASGASSPLHRRKLETARYYFDYVLPEAQYRFALVSNGRRPLPWAGT